MMEKHELGVASAIDELEQLHPRVVLALLVRIALRTLPALQASPNIMAPGSSHAPKFVDPVNICCWLSGLIAFTDLEDSDLDNSKNRLFKARQDVQYYEAKTDEPKEAPVEYTVMRTARAASILSGSKGPYETEKITDLSTINEIITTITGVMRIWDTAYGFAPEWISSFMQSFTQDVEFCQGEKTGIDELSKMPLWPNKLEPKIISKEWIDFLTNMDRNIWANFYEQVRKGGFDWKSPSTILETVSFKNNSVDENVQDSNETESDVENKKAEDLNLSVFSASVRSARELLNREKEVTATMLAQAIIDQGHKDYGNKIAGELKLETEQGERVSVDEWLQKVYLIFESFTVDTEVENFIIDGRLVIWALANLDQTFSSQSHMEEFLLALRTEIDSKTDILKYLDSKVAESDVEGKEETTKTKNEEVNILLTNQLIEARYAPEDPDADDLMKVGEEAKSFARYITKENLTTPLAIGLFGDWGSGKTFFMRKMKTFVEEYEKHGRNNENNKSSSWCSNVIQIEFNAWHYIESNLWASLVEHIFSEMDAWLTKEKKSNAIDELYKVFESAQEVKREAEAELNEAVGEHKDASFELVTATNAYDEAKKKHNELNANDIWLAITTIFKAQLKEDKELTKKIKEASDTLGVVEIKNSARKLNEIVEQASDVGGRSKILLSSLFSRKRNAWQYGLLLLFVAVTPFLVGIIWNWIGSSDVGNNLTHRIGAGVAELSALITVITGWGAIGLNSANKALVALEKADVGIRDVIDQKSKEQREELEKAETVVATIKERVTLAEQRFSQADHAVDKARQRLASEKPRERLTKFLRRRLDNADYAKHLGVITMIRKDFDLLSRIMTGKDWGEEETKKMEKAGVKLDDARTFERIILYIDDLDRCPADRVVEVLQAVHLLLAFPLFVVVVGVDARWVSRALSLSYPHLLSENVAHDIERAPSYKSDKENEANNINNNHNNNESLRVSELIASSHDYLEKIFQIPYWVKPMDAEASIEFIEKLATNSNENNIKDNAKVIKQPEVSPEDMEFRNKESGEEAVKDNLLETELQNTKNTAEANAQLDFEKTMPVDIGITGKDEYKNKNIERDQVIEPPELTLIDLPLSKYEINFMKLLAPNIGRSPRRSKRFFNVYQLVRAGLSKDERTNFIGKHGESLDYRVLMSLLAIVTGSPILAPQFFAKVVEWDNSKNISLEKLINNISKDERFLTSSEWGRLLGALEILLNFSEDEDTFKKVRYWTRRAMRFSFTARPV